MQDAVLLCDMGFAMRVKEQACQALVLWMIHCVHTPFLCSRIIQSEPHWLGSGISETKSGLLLCCVSFCLCHRSFPRYTICRQHVSRSHNEACE